MDERNQSRINAYFEKMQLEVLRTGFTRIDPRRWVHDNVAPNFSCLYYIVEGSGSFTVRKQSYAASAGQLVILPAGVPHCYSSSSSDPFRKYWCHFNAHAGDIHLFQLLDIPSCFHVSDPARTHAQFEKLHAAYRGNGPLDALKAKSLLFDIVIGLLEEPAAQPLKLSASRTISRVNDILQYIDDHLHEPLTAQLLASKFNYNPKYFIRLFKSGTHMTPMHYINKTRLDYAKQLLVTTDLSISEVSVRSGFEVQYFSKIFKKQVNLTPSKYRELARD